MPGTNLIVSSAIRIESVGPLIDGEPAHEDVIALAVAPQKVNHFYITQDEGCIR